MRRPLLLRPRRRGIALMEALIAILLLSLSALAYAALQMKGLSANSSSLWRSKATLLAYDMADRMRANREAMVAGGFDMLTVPVSVTDCGVATNCTAARMSLLDYDLWNTALQRELPGGTGVVCVDGTPDDGTAEAPGCDGNGAARVLAVKVFWSERGHPSRLAVAVRR